MLPFYGFYQERIYFLTQKDLRPPRIKVFPRDLLQTLMAVLFSAFSLCTRRVVCQIQCDRRKLFFLQDKRLFQCGSQEAGLVKYDKYTCKKWAVGLGYNENTRYKIHNKQFTIWKIKCTLKYKSHTVLEVGRGIVKEGAPEFDYSIDCHCHRLGQQLRQFLKLSLLIAMVIWHEAHQRDEWRENKWLTRSTNRPPGFVWSMLNRVQTGKRSVCVQFARMVNSIVWQMPVASLGQEITLWSWAIDRRCLLQPIRSADEKITDAVEVIIKKAKNTIKLFSAQ